jgi:hypothetical protein
MVVAMETRNAGLEDLVALLREQHARKIDMVVPASAIRAEEGLIRVRGAEPVITEDGVAPADGLYRPTEVFDEGLAEKLRIPLSYVRRLRRERVDLYDANANGWLHGRKAKVRQVEERTEIVREAIPGDERSFMIRAFRGDGGVGVARALLSDRYSIMDNLDVLTAALDGVRQAGVEVQIDGCDLSERRMYVRLVSPEITAMAPKWLGDYRSPFDGRHGRDLPVVHAGLVISNSEVGNGAFSITPRLLVQVCRNGLVIKKDAMRSVHLGGRLDEGTVQWSSDTQQKNIALVTAKTRDAVRSFLSAKYVMNTVWEIEAKAGTQIDRLEQVQTVTKSLKFSEDQQDEILKHFTKAGDWSLGGVMNAVTSAAKSFDADAAAEMEETALSVLDVKVPA